MALPAHGQRGVNEAPQRKKNREISFEASLCKFQKDHHRAQPLVDWADTLEDKYARREILALFSSASQELKPINKSISRCTEVEKKKVRIR